MERRFAYAPIRKSSHSKVNVQCRSRWLSVGSSLIFFFLVSISPSFGSSGFEVAQGTLLDTYVTNQWTSFTFVTSFDTVPLVFAIATDQGPDPCSIRVTGITTSGFQASCLEPSAEDGPHASMDFHYLAIEPGLYDLPLVGGGTLTVEAGFVDTTTVQHNCGGGCGATGWDTVSFNTLFSTTLSGAPAVLTQIQGLGNETNNGATPSVPFLSSVVDSGSITTTGFRMALERSESPSGSVTQNERLGWFAMPAGAACHTLDLGGGATLLFEAMVSPRSFDGWGNGCNGSLAFTCPYAGPPILIASKASRHGGDGGWLRRCALSATAVSFTVDEDQDSDAERNHVTEVAAAVSFASSVATTVPSYTLVSDFSLHTSEAGAVASWRTSAEAGAASYYLLAGNPHQNLRKLHSRPIPALLSAPQGANYRVPLSAEVLEPGTQFWLLEETLAGERRRHGPWTPQPSSVGIQHRQEPGAELELEPFSWPRQPTTATTGTVVADSRRSTVKRNRPGVSDLPQVINIGVGATGLHGIPLHQLAEAFGRPESTILRWAQSSLLALSHDGVAVAWELDSAQRRLLFFAHENEDPLRAQAIYQMRHSKVGLTFEQLRVSPGGADPDGTYRGRSRFQQNRFFVTAVPLNADLDLWMWQGFHSAHPDFAVGEFDFDLEAFESEGPVALSIVVQGASSRADRLVHRVGFEINGHALPEQRFFDLDRITFELQVPGSWLQAQGNQLRIQALGGLPASDPSLFFLDRFEVIYDRRYQSDRSQLLFQPAAGEWVESGITTVSANESLHLFSLQDPQRPRRLVGFHEFENNGRKYASFQARSEAEHLVVGDHSLLQPTGLWGAPKETLRSRVGAEYLVISPASWTEAAQTLSAWRRADGLSTDSISMEEIYHQFAFGHQDPRALGQFLEYAHSQWPIAPRYVVLVGDGHLDYQNHWGLRPNPIPPRMITTAEGLYSSDASFGDFDGDGAPEVAIGRLPITSKDQFYGWFEKLKKWEEASGNWRENALLVSDVPDRGGNFHGVAEQLAAGLADGASRSALGPSSRNPLWSPQTLSMASLGFESARQSLIEQWSQGVGLVTWVGHGGSDRWARDGILTEQDLSLLSSDQRSALVVALGCNTNRFELPGFASLGGGLTLHPEGGAVAVLAPSGATRLNQMYALGANLNQSLGRVSAKARLGDLILRAMHQTVSSPQHVTSAETLKVYLLFGDPAMRLR